MKLLKAVVKMILIISLPVNSAGWGYLCPEALAKGHALRPAATYRTESTAAHNPGKGSSSGLESHFLQRALECYPFYFWSEFLERQGGKLNGPEAEEISRLAASLRRASGEDLVLPEAFPIRTSPEESYSLVDIIRTKAEYEASAEELDLVGRLELWWLQRVCGYKMMFSKGISRRELERPSMKLTMALQFAFGEQWQDVVKFLINSVGKIIFYAENSPYQVKVDIGGNYFRISDTRLRRNRHGHRPWIFEEGGVVSRHKGPHLEYSDGFRLYKTRAPAEISELAKELYPEGIDKDMPRRELIYLIYRRSTHFTIAESTEQFPILPHFIRNNWPRRPSFSLQETLGILRSELDIKDVEIRYIRPTLKEEEEAWKPRKGGWCFEISNDKSSAIVTFSGGHFSFVQHFYRRRQNFPGTVSEESGPKPSSCGKRDEVPGPVEDLTINWHKKNSPALFSAHSIYAEIDAAA